MKKTICIDFDGVLHNYSKGWQDGTIYDGPKPGAAQAMSRLLELGYEVVIYSTRCYSRFIKGAYQESQVKEVQEWLKKWQIPYSYIYLSSEKPLCSLFVDDRAYRFEGNWDMEIDKIVELAKK